MVLVHLGLDVLGIVLAASIVLCDYHRICSEQHDWIGLGGRPWPEKHYGIYDLNKLPATHPRCKLGDRNWKNDCKEIRK